MCSPPLLCGLMSYSSSRWAGLIKVERDNSLSCSLELATLVIPWETFYVLCIKFVSLPVSHALLLLCPCVVLVQLCLSFFAHPLLHSFSLAFELTFSPSLMFSYPFPFSVFSFSSLVLFTLFFCCVSPVLVPIFTFFSQYFALFPLLSLSPSLFLSLFTLPPELDTETSPFTLSAKAQLAGLIDQWSS